MADRQIGDPLLIVLRSVSAVGHDAPDEPVGVGQRILGGVHETLLHAGPLGVVSLPGRRVQGMQVHVLDAVSPAHQLALGLTPVPDGLHGAVVLPSRTACAARRAAASST